MPPVIQVATNTITAAASGTTTFARNVQPGNCVVAFVGINTASPNLNSLADSQGNTYQFRSLGGGTNFSISNGAASNVKGGPLTTTFTLSGSAASAVMVLVELSGILPATSQAALYDPNTQSAANQTATTTITRSSLIGPTTTPTIDIAAAINNGSNTYSALAGWQLVTNSANGTLNMGITYRYIPAGTSLTGFATIMTQSSTANAFAGDFCMRTSFQQLNNFQFVKAGDGMSVSEKIR